MKDYTLEKRKYVIGAAAIVIVLIYVFRLFDLQIMTDPDHCRFVAVGAPDTVRCPLSTVGARTRRAWIARPTVGAVDRWITGQSGEF